MAFFNNTDRFTYVNISKGKFVIKKDEVKTEWGGMSGLITDIKIEDDSYQETHFKQICLTMIDGDDTYQLQIRMDSGYGLAFCCMAPNIDYTKKVYFSAAFQEATATEKQKGSLFIKQAGKNLKWYFTKDDRKDLPQIKKITFKGQDHWDNTEQQAYFIKMLETTIKEKIPHELMAGPATDIPETNTPAGTGDAADDLPF